MTVKETARRDPKSLIGRAYLFSEKAHKGQKRTSGEPYFTHVLAAAEILNQWHVDDTTIAAGLLHDVVEDTPATREDMVHEFGEEIAFLIDGVTKLGRIKYRGDEAKVENLRKLILALSQDLRVVFVKLADRLHNMRTLSALPPQKQKRIALETDEIYAPLSYRLGMHEVSGELHDLAFPYLHPHECRWLKDHVRDEYETRLRYLEQVKPLLEKTLTEASLAPLSLDFRAKRAYSLYAKLTRYDMDLGKVYDLVALRIIFPTVRDCYAALGTIHQHWPPVPGRIKDYIAMPKANNYRGLHTTVIGPEEKYIEIQLRTKEMHDENEYGIAAHWFYKQETRSGRPAMALSEKGMLGKKASDALRWVRELRTWQEKYRKEEISPSDFLDATKVEFFKGRIFAITPRGDVIDLPEGATPVDFAYHIHTSIGDSCVGAKINGTIVSLNHTLKSGDAVEILTQKNKRPSQDWLQFVKTGIARDHIRAALRITHHTLAPKRSPTKAELRIAVEDRIGLMKDITSVIARSHINIIGFHTDHTPGSRYPIDKVTIATADKQKIEKLMLKLKKIREVKEISYKIL